LLGSFNLKKIIQAARNQISKNLSKPESLSRRQNSQLESFLKNRLRFKWRQILAVTEEACGRDGLRAISCQAEKQPERKDAHRNPVLPDLTAS